MPWYQSLYNGSIDTMNKYNIGTCFVGGIKVFGGIAEATAGGCFALGTAATAIGPVAGSAIFAHGIDNAIAGANQMWTGYPQDCATVHILEKVGISHTAATNTNDAISLVGLCMYAAGAHSARKMTTNLYNST